MVRKLLQFLLWVGVITGVLVYWSDVYDFYVINTYTPSVEVKEIMAKAGMSGDGEKIFLASRPSIEGTTNFNEVCDVVEMSSATLGCYSAGKIYLYDVKNSQIEGVEVVTAVHEMLHAGYERLNYWEKEELNALLKKEIQRQKNNQEFSEHLSLYDENDRSLILNEAHSILATEVKDLSTELEDYYSRYFDDRQKVLDIHTGYVQIFSDLENQSKELLDKINRDTDQINQNITEYEQRVSQLSHDIQTFNSRADTGYFSSEHEFNAERNNLVYQQQQLENFRNNINAMIQQNEVDRQKLKELSVEINNLNNNLDSNFAPLPEMEEL